MIPCLSLIGSFEPESLLDRIAKVLGKRLPAPMPSYALTHATPHGIIAPLLPLEAVGIRTPFFLGQKMTAPLAVFFRLSCRAGLIRFYSVMAGLFGLPSGRPRLDAVVRTHSNPSPKSFEPLRGGLSLFSRINPMPQNQSAPNNQHSHAVRSSVFDIFLFRRLIASNVPDIKAQKIKAKNPNCIVKFIGWGI